jgi:hypothetical protein
MVNININLYEETCIVGVIDPDVTVAGAVSTGWIAAKDMFSYMAIIMAGTLGTAATLDAKLEQATDGSGTGAKDITGKAITQLVKASNDDDQAVINIKQQDLDIENDFTHFRLTMTVAVADSDVAGLVLGSAFRHGDGSDNDLASVVEVV